MTSLVWDPSPTTSFFVLEDGRNITVEVLHSALLDLNSLPDPTLSYEISKEGLDLKTLNFPTHIKQGREKIEVITVDIG